MDHTDLDTEPDPWSWLDDVRKRAVSFLVSFAVAGVFFLVTKALLRITGVF